MGNTNTIPPSPLRVPNFFLFFPTAMPRINPAKAWCFTLNNYTENELGALVQLFSSLDDKYYYIVGEEVGEEGTPHLQGYIEKKDGRFRPLPKFAVRRQCVATIGEVSPPPKNAMHFEKAKGNRTQNYKYCSKDGKFVTNIPRPVMTYREAKGIWAVTKGLRTDDYSGADIEEAALHIQFAEDYDKMSDSAQRVFLAEYKAMMAARYPDV